MQIGEECTFHIESGGWFGFQTPGFTYIAVQNINVTDQLPLQSQGWISNTDPTYSAADPGNTSTSLITGFIVTPAPLTSLFSGQVNWGFNPAANRIQQKDEWFRVNLTDRLLNSMPPAGGTPNLHAFTSSNVMTSTFDAVFHNDITGSDDIYTLGPTTIGYPLAPARTVNLTVTEPKLILVKEACNETLHGVGAACNTWSSFVNDGDTADKYMYRITVTNEATASGVTRAPAYDVVVTDTLDTSHHKYMIDALESDGINNDDDLNTDENSPPDTEGQLVNNVLNDAV